MKDRQAGGGAKSGRYKKHDAARLRCLRRVVYPRLKMGILPSATDSKMLFDMPGVYHDDEFLAFNSGMGVRTSPQADRLDEFMAADAGYVPPPRYARRVR
ncbi:hypothetical protein JL722_5250 [Aureococcus anophagefferens]|nr:hypothetical protein JL722_5250 [Aureococcus anophagefferens]